ncbi:hypothetical protein [Seleniivibrio woodruffii]|uniref:Uncharacterized protein n=1 Tax=Seleniivibrio woodruffii TaxID=1078050 RepID=A0A4R1KBK6_9BACT|nr:hypothetical protein [Seleniivibrio woodruffii]TCK60549.1 hypothetical protein C8D98_1426 [Seleniivibrio woodruffii]TVZ36177.1 hypothetical protein OF66_1801 [Seleniivibrio woodruffii]
MKPEICPFCGEKRLEELEPTEIMVDNSLWVIHHYECQFCTEVFDKIIPEGELEYDIDEEADIYGDTDEKRFRN